jgi:hypothetical protein
VWVGVLPGQGKACLAKAIEHASEVVLNMRQIDALTCGLMRASVCDLRVRQAG